MWPAIFLVSTQHSNRLFTSIPTKIVILRMGGSRAYSPARETRTKDLGVLTKTIVILTPSRYSAPRGHVSYDPTLASKFDLIREPDETVSWVGRPHFVPYLISGLPVFVVGCLWLAFDINLMRGMHRERRGSHIAELQLGR